MNFQEFKKEARKTALVFAVGLTTGGAVGTGLDAAFQTTNAAAPAATVATSNDNTTRLRVPTDHRTVVEADVIQASADGMLVVRAHSWVGQYMITRVQQTGSTAGAPYSANITDANGQTVSDAKKGSRVYLRGLTSQATTGMAVELPNVKPVSDKIDGPVQARVLRVIDGDTPAVRGRNLARPFRCHQRARRRHRHAGEKRPRKKRIRGSPRRKGPARPPAT